MSPQRIQRKRTRGWRTPEGVIYVGRGTKWGNPFRPFPCERSTHGDGLQEIPGVHWHLIVDDADVLAARWADKGITTEWAVKSYGMRNRNSEDEIRAELAGKDLACWCPLDQPCHADVLLKLANQDDVLTTALADTEGQALVQAILDRKQGLHT